MKQKPGRRLGLCLAFFPPYDKSVSGEGVKIGQNSLRICSDESA
jgi:hypothetical protein